MTDFEITPEMERELRAVAAAQTKTGVTVTREDVGIRLSLIEPLDFVWQTDAQIRDLIEKLKAMVEP